MRRAALIAALVLSLGAASDAAADVVVVSADGVQPRRAHVAPDGTDSQTHVVAKAGMRIRFTRRHG